MTVTPSFTRAGNSATATALIDGAVDPQSAVEIGLPYWDNGSTAPDLEVRLNGALAGESEYRITRYGVKVRVGSEVTQVEVRYTPHETWSQTGWTQNSWSERVPGPISLNQFIPVRLNANGLRHGFDCRTNPMGLSPG